MFEIRSNSPRLANRRRADQSARALTWKRLANCCPLAVSVSPVRVTGVFLLAPLFLFLLPLPLIGAFEDAHSGDRTASVRSQQRLYGGDSLDEWRDRMTSIDPAGPQIAEFVPGLTALMQDPAVPSEIRRQAALLLGRIGKPALTSLDALIGLLDEPGTGLDAPALWAIKALSLLGAQAREATPSLVKILRDTQRSHLERISSIEALGQIGPAHSDVVPILISVVQKRIKPSENRPTETVREFREIALEAIQVIGPSASSAIPAIIRVSTDSYEGIRRRAINALGAMGPAGEIAIPAIAENLVFDESHAVRDAAGDALAAIGASAVPLLRGLTQDEDPEVRWRATAALGRMGKTVDNAAIADVQRLLEDTDAVVRVTACETLWAMTADANRILSTLVRELTNPDRQIRIRAYRLLTTMGPDAKAAVAPVRKLLKDERSYVRQIARMTLERIDVP